MNRAFFAVLTMLISLALLGAGVASAAGVKRAHHGNGVFNCERPEAPALPDGDTATAEEMEAADAASKQYAKDMNRFANCSSATLSLIIIGNSNDIVEAIRHNAYGDRNRHRAKLKKEKEKFTAR